MASIAESMPKAILFMQFCGIPLVALCFWFWTRAFAWTALRLGLWDMPIGRKDHAKPILLVGGLALLSAFCLLIFFYALQVAITQKLLFFTAGGILTGLFGLYDDRLKSQKKDVAVWVKLALQVGSAVLPVIGAIQLKLFGNPTLNILFSVLWIVAITNAWNFFDNMDGLAAGCGFFAALSFAVAFLLLQEWKLSLSAGLLAGFCLGFLPYNFPRAKFFLGDSGSAVLGYLFAILSIEGSYVHSEGPGLLAVFFPLTVMAVPLFDMLQVILARLLTGNPIYIGDHRHVSHRLAQRLQNRTHAVLAIWLLSAVLGGLSVLVVLLPFAHAASVFASQAILFGLFLLYTRKLTK